MLGNYSPRKIFSYIKNDFFSNIGIEENDVILNFNEYLEGDVVS